MKVYLIIDRNMHSYEAIITGSAYPTMEMATEAKEKYIFENSDEDMDDSDLEEMRRQYFIYPIELAPSTFIRWIMAESKTSYYRIIQSSPVRCWLERKDKGFFGFFIGWQAIGNSFIGKESLETAKKHMQYRVELDNKIHDNKGEKRKIIL